MKFTSLLLPVFITLVGLSSSVHAVRPRTTPFDLFPRQQIPDACESPCDRILDPSCNDACACRMLDVVEECLQCGVREGTATQAEVDEARQQIEAICASIAGATSSTTSPSQTITFLPTSTLPTRTTISATDADDQFPSDTLGGQPFPGVTNEADSTSGGTVTGIDGVFTGAMVAVSWVFVILL